MKFIIIIAFRHLWSRHNFGFISFSTILSILGVMLGVASLIVISCVTDGFNKEIYTKLSSIDGHLRINSFVDNRINNLYLDKIDSLISYSKNNINFSYPYIEEHSIIRKGSISSGVIVYGVEEAALNNIFQLDRFTKKKNIYNNNYSIIIGSKLAEKLNVNINDDLIIFDPNQIYENKFTAAKFTVNNIFQTNFPEYDRILVFIPYKIAQKYYNYNKSSTGIIINSNNADKIEEDNIIISDLISDTPLMLTTWKDRHSNLINWLTVYDIPIKLIMFFITIVAIFNIAATLWMIIIEKYREYGILASIGVGKSLIMCIILAQGLIISIAGSILGVVISLIILFIEKEYHLINLPNDIYFMDFLPVELSFTHFIYYPVFAIILSIIITYFPARKIKYMSLSESLRCE